MIDKFMLSPYPNTIAVIVLVALIISWILSVALIFFRSQPIPTGKGWYAWLVAGFTLLAAPAIVDLLQTSDLTALLFATVAFLSLLANLVALTMLAGGRDSQPFVKEWFRWGIPVLAVGGLAVAGYVTFVEALNAPVICGASKGCQDVQSSKYSIVFGFLPVGTLGFMGLIAILAAWLFWQFGPLNLRRFGALGIWAFALFGVLFSTYLTFLEPFVIGATCMWCITSAVFMILLLQIITPAAKQALTVVYDDDDEDEDGEEE